MIMSDVITIFKDLYSEDYEVEDKMTAIQEIAWRDRVSHTITKQDLKNALTWLIDEYI